MSEGTSEEGEWITARNIEELDGVQEAYAIKGIGADLVFAEECLGRFAQMAESPDDQSKDLIAMQALMSAAVMAYCRCFNTGVRLRLTEDDVDALPNFGDGVAMQIHGILKSMRDKHIAHSISPFDFVMLGGVVAADDLGQPSYGVAQMTGSGTPFDGPSSRQLQQYVGTLLMSLNSRLDACLAQVQAAMADEGPEAMLKRPEIGFVVPGVDQFKDVRHFGRGISASQD